MQQKANWETIDKNNAYSTPANQVKRLEEAGLNPSLIYGGGGAGGTTMGNTAVPSVNAGNASDESSRIMAEVAKQGMALQLAKTQSEIAVNNATANKLNTDADVRGNEERENLKQQTVESQNRVNNINAQIDNLKADTALKGEETKLNKLQQN